MITVLIDNTPHPTGSSLLTEHGLSLYFEIGGKKCMLDVGASDGFYFNAKRLGIAVEEVDILFISHGHNDHTGGLNKFLEINSKAKIYLSSHIIGRSFYSSRRGTKRDISTPKIELSSRFQFIDQNTSIESNNIQLITTFGNKHPKPMGNASLSTKEEGTEKSDTFDHEMALLLNTGQGYIVLSACTHNGILNTLSACTDTGIKGSDITAYIGGTHLLDNTDLKQYETETDTAFLCETLQTCYPNLRLFTGHCTGTSASKIFSDSMKDKFCRFYSGCHINIQHQ